MYNQYINNTFFTTESKKFIKLKGVDISLGKYWAVKKIEQITSVVKIGVIREDIIKDEYIRNCMITLIVAK